MIFILGKIYIPPFGNIFASLSLSARVSVGVRMQLANGGEIEIVPAYQIMRVSPEDKISLKRLHSIKTDDFVLSHARERERRNVGEVTSSTKLLSRVRLEMRERY